MEEDEDLYDCVENEEAEGDEIYEDLMRSEPGPSPVRAAGGGAVGCRGGAVGCRGVRGAPASSSPCPPAAQDDRV